MKNTLGRDTMSGITESGGIFMYKNAWSVHRTLASITPDVVLVPVMAYASLMGREPSTVSKKPLVVLESGSAAAVLVPSATTPRKTQKLFKEAGLLAHDLSAQKIAVVVDTLSPSDVAAALWGVGQAIYRYQDLATLTTGPEVMVVSSNGDLLVLRELTLVAQNQSLARDLVNLPSNLKPPHRLAEWMQMGSPDSIHWQTFDETMLQELGAGGILGVGQGSHRPPCMLVGRYEGRSGGPWLGLVGKGITFDSGGISLKPGEGMGRMKGDMGGAAAVIGALRTVAELGWPVNVLAVTPLAENLPGGGAYRPGDVLTMMDGTTVEVISTDAEGRLVLGDGVTWVLRQGVSAVVDIATLTGANVVALGGIRSGLLCTDEALRRIVVDATNRMAEPAWELPHDEDYFELIKTSMGDIKNSGGRPAGTITAGLFVGHFAKTTPWAHLDIAGMAFEAGTGVGAGATGFGVATLVEICRRFGEAAHKNPA